MSTGNCAAIILAAGLSTRMKGFKPLLEIGGVTIADRVISLFRDFGIDVILVTGWQQDELLAGIRSRDIIVVENPDYKTGMLSSVQAGVRRLKPEHTSFCMMPVDIPLVRPATVRRLLEILTQKPGMIFFPTFHGKRGHPPVIPASLGPEITGWQGEGGLNMILRRHNDLQVEIPVADSFTLADADDRNDYSRLLKRYERYNIPNDEECRALLDIAGTPERTRKHCRKVAEIAVKFAEALVDAGVTVDADEVRAGSLLHDIAKGLPYHGAEGAKILVNHGFERIGNIISIHQDLIEDTASVDIETKLVYFSDKMVIDEEVIPVEERYRDSEEKYGHIPEAAAKIRFRKERALQVKAELEGMLGGTVESAIFG